jgi:hypothetical protein
MCIAILYRLLYVFSICFNEKYFIEGIFFKINSGAVAARGYLGRLNSVAGVMTLSIFIACISILLVLNI